MNKNLADKKRRNKLRLFFTFSVFLILLSTFILLTSTIYILMSVDILHIQTIQISEWFLVLIFMISSLMMGTIITFLLSKYVLRAVNTVADGMSSLAEGNLDVKIDLGKMEEAKKLSNAFNSLAEELKGIQMLRADFVNEYAHEFKTPIVSIKGFAELLQQKNLSEEQKNEYIDIIIEEANRLSTLSSNSLNLSKIENQRILTDLSTFNVSEQIRNSILLFENKWLQKNIDLQISFDEYYISANEEMLKQVWINLIDNAIKFSNNFDSIEMKLYKDNDKLLFSIKNAGTIIEEKLEKIFDKFYRAKNSNESGHGVGLAVVKKIIELHKGSVEAKSYDGFVEIIIRLPLA